MSEKFSKDDIAEIASRLEWKPNQLSYNILYIVLSLSLLYILLMIYLIMQYSHLKCRFKEIDNKIEDCYSGFSNKIQDNFENNVRYMITRSERNSNNVSLSERHQMPMFENEKEHPELFSALAGN